jgi:Asp-tRNA(Asn)/Glu-tRNA(Gln) amidotransferase A subunit family amidase
LGHHPDPDHGIADAEGRHRRYLTISDNPDVLDWFGNLWRNFAFTLLANLCGIPAISLPLAIP